MNDKKINQKQEVVFSQALRQEGMTLIEIMIVVMIMAMIATGVAVAVIPQMQKAQVKSTKIDVAAIRTAVQLYIAENPADCPTVEDLKKENYLDKTKRTTDPWDKEFVINCADEDEPDVFSLGKDGQEGTEDDIR